MYFTRRRGGTRLAGEVEHPGPGIDCAAAPCPHGPQHAPRAATGRNTVRPSTTTWPLLATDGEPGDSADDTGMDVEKVTEELDKGGYERLHRRTQSTSEHGDQCGDVVEELEVWAVTERRWERELLLTHRICSDDQHHLTRARWMNLWVMRSR